MKRFILSLFVGLFGFLCFCNAGSYTYSGIANESNPLPLLFVPQTSFDTNITLSCVFTPLSSCEGDGSPMQFRFQFSYFYGNSQKANLNTASDYYNVNCNGSSLSLYYDFSTFSSSGPYAGYKGVALVQFPNFYSMSNYDVFYSCTFQGDYILNNPGGGSCPDCPSCPEVNTGEILSGYILESEIDTNYCVLNGYCPNECGSGLDMSGDLQFSNLYINNILHPGQENIYVDIPDYINWDYSVDTGSFNLYVGSGYDQEYIDSILSINSYRPGSEDFTNIFVSGLTLIFPYIALALLFLFIWKLLKKIFPGGK